MQKLDALNARYGKESVQLATALGGQHGKQAAPWKGRQQQRSPAYTTCWEELWQVG
ncbi:DUF4113 domain-containing protein [Hymenobacter humi]|uniref:DUF4113 domain-containing protein n=1 Tax=Hymenobacter humi TaxID=1411620 RepID=A0ABW2U872_9BACT